MGWIYGIFMVGLLAAVGYPMAKTYLDTQEAAVDCMHEALRTSSGECLNEVGNRIEAQVVVAKTVMSVLPGAPSVPEKEAEQ